LPGAAGQFDRDAAEKRIDLVFVVTAPSNLRLGERHIVNVRRSDATPRRRIAQRCLNAIEKRVNLVFVVTPTSPGGIRESQVVDIFWS
jgi:hypothetical protein